MAPNTSSGNANNRCSPSNKRDKSSDSFPVPTLKKTSKPGFGFGSLYYNSVKSAVFDIPSNPFKSPEIPESLRLSDSDIESLYTCDVCKDCYRFSSTLKEHIGRRSWILGYWCQYCFQMKCTHVESGKPICSTCQSAQSLKRAYLRSKGMKKGQRVGAIRIFYNQCQFFTHLRTHRIMSVEICDLMLMPLPTEVKAEDHEKLDKACKAIMEYGFLHRVHIMELLQEQKVEGDWWNLQSSHLDNKYSRPKSDRSVSAIMSSFWEGDMANVPEGLDDEDDPFANNLISITKNRNDLSKKSYPAKKNNQSSNNNQSSINNQAFKSNSSADNQKNLSIGRGSHFHSPYRPPADIAFVDCGPTPVSVIKTKEGSPSQSCKKNSSLEYKPTTSNGMNKINQNLNKQVQQIPKQSSTSTSVITTSILTSIASTSSNKVYTVSTCTTASNTGPKISVKKFASDPATNWTKLRQNSNESNNQQLQTNNTKILTIRSEKCLDISSIISQLPANVMNSKKIVFIEQNSNQLLSQKKAVKNPTLATLSSSTLSANCIKVIPQQNLVTKQLENKNNKLIPILPAAIAQVSQPSVNSGLKKCMTVERKITPTNLGVCTQKSSSTTTLDGRNFYQSGKKYVIKQNIIKNTVPTTSVLKMTNVTQNIIQSSNPGTCTVSKTIAKTSPSINSKASEPISKVSNFIISSVSPLTLSPAPIEKTSESSSDTIGKKNTKFKDKVIEKVSPNVKIKNKGTDNHEFNLTNISFSKQKLLFVKYDSNSRPILYMSKKATSAKNTKCNVSRFKQAMLDNLPFLEYKEIEKRIEHLKALSQNYIDFMKSSDDGVITGYKELISCLEETMKKSKLPRINENKDNLVVKKSDDNDEFSDLVNWEKKQELMYPCPFCGKLKKSNNYLAGFSKLSINEARYCQCYNCHCSTCNTYQGNVSRFEAHVNYHKKVNPHTCPECSRKFTNSDQLEKHLWSECFHPLIRNWLYGCKICGIDGILTMESLIQHFLMMHCEKGFVCIDCHRIFFSREEHREHWQMDHLKRIKEKEDKIDEVHGLKNVKKRGNQIEIENSQKILPHPVEIIMCKAGQCIATRENFKYHLIDHVGFEKQIFFKCPFCNFLKRDGKGVKKLFKDHMFSHHSSGLLKYMNFEILNEIRKMLKHSGTCNKEILPLIVNTRTIAQEAFDQGTTIAHPEDSLAGECNSSIKKSNYALPMIVDVRSEAVDNTDSIPKILEVKSMAKGSPVKIQNKYDYSRKRKSNAVIQISGPPEKIRGIESVDGNIDGKLSERKFENSRKVEKKKEKNNDNSTELIMNVDIINQEIPRVDKVSVIGNSSGENNTSVNERESLKCTEEEEEKDFCKQEEKCTNDALEHLKAKMNRTFRSLAKKIESRSTVLQQEQLNASHRSSEIIKEHLKSDDLEMGRLDRMLDSESDEYLMSDKDNSSDIIELPPLSRIPRHLIRSKSVGNEKFNEKPAKIAFNGPVDYEPPVVDFKCHVCNKMVDSSWEVLKTHFDSWHQEEYKIFHLNPQASKFLSDNTEAGYYRGKLTTNYKSEIGPKKRKKKSRTPNKMEKVSWENSAGICITAEPLENDDGSVKCKKCDMKFSAMNELREHISKTHRIKGRYLVCLECGENFVVTTSLQMHLKAFHAIDDPFSYLLQNTNFAPENLDDTEEEEEEVTTEANQCYVCMAVFEDKAAVDKHLRVHGMAFLNRKRMEAKKKLRSSQKKFKAALQTIEMSDNPEISKFQEARDPKNVECSEVLGLETARKIEVSNNGCGS